MSKSLIPTTLLIVVVFTLITFVVHRIRTAKEINMLKDKGYYNPVSVGEYSLNVAKFGNENSGHTIVSLAGLGNGDYSVTQRHMTAELEDDYLVVFVDRAGYGLSEDTNNDMTLEYIVDDYRKALNAAKIEAPYVLISYSDAGFYANYWASSYPDEIEAVVFVDSAILCKKNLIEDLHNNSGSVGLWDKFIVLMNHLGFGRYILHDYSNFLPE